MTGCIVKQWLYTLLIYFRIPGMLQLVGLLPSDVNEYLRKLVLSFELSANNVVLKTNEWTLVGIILLKM